MDYIEELNASISIFYFVFIAYTLVATSVMIYNYFSKKKKSLWFNLFLFSSIIILFGLVEHRSYEVNNIIKGIEESETVTLNISFVELSEDQTVIGTTDMDVILIYGLPVIAGDMQLIMVYYKGKILIKDAKGHFYSASKLT